MVEYYDRAGLPITLEEWTKLFEIADYQSVKKSRHKEGGKEFILSTVWLGLDHNWGYKGDPIIFEAMAFELKPKEWNGVIGQWGEDLTQVRYATEEEALAGHKASIEMY